MNNNPCPLEYLASFAISFAAGVVTTAALGTYAKSIQKRVSIAK